MRTGRAAVGAAVGALVLLCADARAVRLDAAAPTAPPPAVVAATTPTCPGQESPPGPPAVEETVAVAPLPWPAEPVGGPGLGGCGDLGPPGVPPVGAAAYVVADLDDGTVLAARAPHARHRPASTLKMLLALLAARALGPDDVVEGTADELRVDGSKAGIGPGGRYTVRQLMAGLLLNSGNDAAQVLARAMGGTEATVAAMCDVAAELGAHDTRAATPSGLDGPGMAMSAYDLALLFRDALREPLVAETIGLRAVPFPGYGDHPGFTLSTTERLLLRYPGALGSKSGFTDAARHTLVGFAEHGGRRLVVALMRGEQRPVAMWQQAAALLDWGFAQPPGPGIGRLVDP
ncbi:D-alanyl-D-alanine carboxypeptidase family protein [Pseudonocardia sp. CA-107938]|uniref:D-alanyl-D-alanine carboxypeptidase family protein n=1 Tax=Pseudonocardia sp. CA-107938 TaxID=3240021 RepID=UPI003D9458C4